MECHQQQHNLRKIENHAIYAHERAQYWGEAMRYKFQKRSAEELAEREAESSAKLDAEFREIARARTEASCTPHENLRRFRKARGLTQEEMAKALDVGRRTYQQYEDGTRSLPLPAMIKLAVWLDCDLNELVLGKPLGMPFATRLSAFSTAIDAFMLLMKEFPGISLEEARSEAAFAAAMFQTDPGYSIEQLRQEIAGRMSAEQLER